VRGAPIHPDEYDGEHLNTDEKLVAEGWAAGLDVWEQVGKGYSEWYLKDDTLGNAQLWSLQEAIRAAERERLAAPIAELHPDRGGFCNTCGGQWPCLTLRIVRGEAS
jgi:hypothetical protein